MSIADLYQIKVKPQAFVLWLALFMLPSSVLAQAEVRRSSSVDDKVEQLERQLQTANRARGEFQFQLTNLQKEIRDLRGIIEEQAYKIEQMTNRQRAIYAELDSFRNAKSSNSSAIDSQISVPDSTQAVTDNQVVSQVPTQKPVDPIVSETDIRAQYDAIFPMVRAKRYDEAIVEYQKFLAAYPDSKFVSNARYWLAQIYNVQGRTDEAEREYLIVSQQYPDASKASDALLKLGELYEKRGQLDQAR